MNKSIENRLAWCLLFCRIAVFIVFMVWVWNKLARPEHGVHMASTYFMLPALPEMAIFIFGLVELVLVFMLLLGFCKRITRGIFVFISLLSVIMPEVVRGYIAALVEQPHPTILFFTGFCVLACSFSIYYLREYDTKWSLADKLSSRQAS